MPLAVMLVGLGAVAGAGYTIGNASSPSQADATAASREASAAVFQRARASGLESGFERGFARGVRAGERRGRRNGRAEGRAAASDYLARRNPRLASERATGGPRPLPGDGKVLVVGDSLEVLTSPYLKRHLPGVPLTVNAVGGYSSPQIFKLFEESYDESHSIVVFDAGTNDNPSYPQILAAQLAAVARIVGDRCMVVPTIHGLEVGGVDSSEKNRVVDDFAASRPGTQVPDWAGAVTDNPELMQSDDLHPLPAGADYRAQLIADGVSACLSGEIGF
jgi:hypothetical protein